MPGLDGFATDAARSDDGGGASAARADPRLRRAPRQSGARRSALRDGGNGRSCRQTIRAGGIARGRRILAAQECLHADRKIAAIFGTAGIAHLLDGFRDLLENQLGLDDGAARYAGAHRLAGIAGTLGFPDLSRLWLAVSEGDDTAYAEARINARKALVEIDANPISAERSRGPGTSR